MLEDESKKSKENSYEENLKRHFGERKGDVQAQLGFPEYAVGFY